MNDTRRDAHGPDDAAGGSDLGTLRPEATDTAGTGAAADPAAPKAASADGGAADAAGIAEAAERPKRPSGPRAAPAAGRPAPRRGGTQPAATTATRPGAAFSQAALPVDPRGREAVWYALGSAVCLCGGYLLGDVEDRIAMTLTGAGCGLFLGMWAVARGTRVNTRATAQGMRAPAALGGIAAGLVLGLLGLMLVIASAMVYPERHAYEECMSGANTHIAQDACTAQYNKSLRENGLPAGRTIDP